MALSFQELEDLRIAIAELCAWCAYGAEPDAHCTCTFTWDGELFEMACSVTPVTSLSFQRAVESSGSLVLNLSDQILAALVDDYELVRADNETRGSLRKQRSLSPTT